MLVVVAFAYVLNEYLPQWPVFEIVESSHTLSQLNIRFGVLQSGFAFQISPSSADYLKNPSGMYILQFQYKIQNGVCYEEQSCRQCGCRSWASAKANNEREGDAISRLPSGKMQRLSSSATLSLPAFLMSTNSNF